MQGESTGESGPRTMEDLQDAVADTRYRVERAMRERIQPLMSIKWPCQRELQTFMTACTMDDPSSFTFETITGQPAGLHLFSKFASTLHPQAPRRLAMMEEVQEFKEGQDASVRVLRATSVFDTFLAVNAESCIDESVRQERTGLRCIVPLIHKSSLTIHGASRRLPTARRATDPKR